jgi:hypothetical protein
MRLFGAAICLLLILSWPALGQEAAETPEITDEGAGKIVLQLNKLEIGENACNTYVVVDNQTPHALKELKIDIYLFDKQGIVLQGVALQFTEVRAAGEMVVPFELAAVTCDEIGRVLLNKVLVCTDGSGASIDGCAGLLVASSLTGIPFEN